MSLLAAGVVARGIFLSRWRKKHVLVSLPFSPLVCGLEVLLLVALVVLYQSGDLKLARGNGAANNGAARRLPANTAVR